MKTKIKYGILVIVTLLSGFTSCSNNEAENTPDNTVLKSMFLKITGTATDTRAAGAAQGAGAVAFTGGHLYFVSLSGDIKKHYTITAAATSSNNIKITDLTGTGVTVNNLPPDVKEVYVVGNTPGLPLSGPIAAVKTRVLQVSSQGDVSNVNLYGMGTLPAVPTTTGGLNDVYNVSLNIAPTVARIELTDIKATGSVITGFEVAGIFVDNYYSRATVDGTVAGADLINNGSDPAAFTDNSPQYPTALKPFVYDWHAPSLGAVANRVVPPGGAAVWGYNLFAPASPTGSSVPRIILRLKNITTTAASDYTFQGDQYITIKGLIDGSSPLTDIEAGKVYRINAGDLLFNEKNLTPIPNLTAIDVAVSVTVAGWITKTLPHEL